MERAEAWGHLMRDYDNVVCLAGTHGKTTSTSMMALITMEAGPTRRSWSVATCPRSAARCASAARGCFVAEKLRILQFLPQIRADRRGGTQCGGGPP